jgi:hypothetical protein
MYDIYVLAKERTQYYIRTFLDNWAMGFEETDAYYSFPEFSDSPETIYDVEALIQRLIDNPGESYAIYWITRNHVAEITTAMLFFTDDGQLIVGVSTRQNHMDPQVLEKNLRSILVRLADDVDGKLGGVFFEERPPSSALEFEREITEGRYPNLIR